MAEKTSELEQNTQISQEIENGKDLSISVSSNENSPDRYEDGVIERDSESTDESTDETDQIRGQIEETRRELGETIDAIQEKLSFQNISEQVKDTVSEQINSALETAKDNVYAATIGKAGKFMKDVGRELSKTDAGKVAASNPFPLFLIGLGVGLLVYQGFNGKKRTYSYNYRNDEDGMHENHRSKLSLKSAQNKIGGAYETVSGAASDTIGKVGSAANSAYENVSSAANETYSGVRNFASTTYDRAGEYSNKAVETYDHYIEENPLVVGAVALAVGAAVGMSVPSTKYEGQLVGEYRQQVFDKVQNVAGDLVERVKEVATEAQKTIGDEVKTAVDETKKTITSEAKNQGLA